MATVNFSVPEEVKEAFNHLYAGENKSAVLTGLMREAIAERKLVLQRQEVIDRILDLRSSGPVVTDEEISQLRADARR